MVEVCGGRPSKHDSKTFDFKNDQSRKLNKKESLLKNDGTSGY